MDVLRRVLELTPPAAETLRAWWDATASIRTEGETPIDRALLGGACADRVGFAFAGGYREALRALVPGLDDISALCATEEGGNTPRAIKTALVEVAPGRYTLTGKKKWATVASEASSLLVVASTGEVEGKNRLRVVRVPVGAPGVVIKSAAAPFVPEIPHAEIELVNVPIDETDILPGDGYDHYLKPFRTVEDIHVHAALLGYLIGVARRRQMPHELIESLLALAATTRGLAAADRGAASTHLALAGLIRLSHVVVGEVEQAWSAGTSDPDVAARTDAELVRWMRDRVLLQVAGSARSARRERAWKELG